VAEDNALPSNLQASPVKFTATTKPCPTIKLSFGYIEPNKCVNQGSVLELSFTPMGATPDIHGIYVGTNYKIIWGDGDILDWNSTATDLVPPDAMLIHTYDGPANCTYEVIIKITSACGSDVVKNFGTKFVIHGRDILDDGDGDMRIEEQGTGVSPIIEICEGVAHTINLVDASKWNCQNPTWLDLSPAPPNDVPRTLQWLYGSDGTTIFNNITGTVFVTGNDATSGYIGAVISGVASPGQPSESISIPATCRVGEEFHVFLNNWDKCNPYGDAVYGTPVRTSIIIRVVDAPVAPNPNDANICMGSAVPP
jgi:hypothetical protein